MTKSVSPATQGYSSGMSGGMKTPSKPVFKSMTLSMQGPKVKAMHSFVDPMHENEHYLFGEGEGKGLMNHISKHLNVKLSPKKMSPEGPEEANAATVNEQEGKE
jgi:hypothetical protein